MRAFEITSGIPVIHSLEEQSILDKAKGEGVNKADLDERDQEVARLMTNKGLLNRGRDSDNNIIYTHNKEKLSRS